MGASRAHSQSDGASERSREAAQGADQAQRRGDGEGVAGKPKQPPTFEWDFGDGVVYGRATGVVARDFSKHLDPARARGAFHVRVRVVYADGSALELKRTVSVLNAYHGAKQRGVIQPPVAFERVAVFEGDVFHGNAVVHNRETYDLVLTSRRVELFFEDDTAPPRRTGQFGRSVQPLPLKKAVPMGQQVAFPQHLQSPIHEVLHAGTETALVMKIPKQAIGPDAVGFAVHYAGTDTHSKLPIRVSAYFDIPSRHRHQPLNSEFARLIARLVEQKVVRDSRAP
jgi:hypothetical protein